MKPRWTRMGSRAAAQRVSEVIEQEMFSDTDLRISFEEMQENAANATVLLKSMANETRLLILCQLAHGERSVSELLDIIPLGQSALSQHLAILRRERLVTTRREGQSVYYALSSTEVRAIIDTLYRLFCDCK